MPELFIVLLVMGVFLGVFFLVSVVRNRRLLRDDPEEKRQDRKAA